MRIALGSVVIPSIPEILDFYGGIRVEPLRDDAIAAELSLAVSFRQGSFDLRHALVGGAPDHTFQSLGDFIGVLNLIRRRDDLGSVQSRGELPAVGADYVPTSLTRF